MEKVEFEYRSKPKKCPRCKSNRVASILWGMPAYSEDLQEKIDAGKVALGGCCLSEDDPKWRCADCHADIYMKVKPESDVFEL